MLTDLVRRERGAIQYPFGGKSLHRSLGRLPLSRHQVRFLENGCGRPKPRATNMTNEVRGAAPTRRRILMALAASPIVALPMGAAVASGGTVRHSVSPQMARLVATYHRRADADDADRSHGDLRAAYNRHKAAFPGPDAPNKRDPERDRWQASFDALNQAEDQHTDDFSEPRWAAAKAVFAMPAATLAEVVAKIRVADREEAVEEIAAQIVADILRLAGVEGQS